jgi:2-polyprenyl-3-methyl-5-hydroxy-6-metoxy-1,4-benzoquinol methylase
VARPQGRRALGRRLRRGEDGLTEGWWHEFFTGPYLAFQPNAWPAEKTRADADWLLDVLEPAPGAALLDVPCGEGRIAIELAARGFRVTGVDITAPLLEIARKRAEQRGVMVDWERRDMRDLPWREEFDAAICYWGSFGYFDDAGNVAFVEAVARSLRAGGRFAVETLTLESLLPRFQRLGWSRSGDMLMLGDRSFDLVTSRLEEEWTFVREGTETRRQSSIRLYTYHELYRIFEDAGFAGILGYDTATHEPFSLRASRLTLVGTRA